MTDDVTKTGFEPVESPCGEKEETECLCGHVGHVGRHLWSILLRTVRVLVDELSAFEECII